MYFIKLALISIGIFTVMSYLSLAIFWVIKLSRLSMIMPENQILVIESELPFFNFQIQMIKGEKRQRVGRIAFLSLPAIIWPLLSIQIWEIVGGGGGPGGGEPVPKPLPSNVVPLTPRTKKTAALDRDSKAA